MNDPAKILLVDDIVTNLKILRDALEPEGYELLVASDGPTALRAAATSLPDLILLDIVMPEMDGYEVCRHLKATEATRAIPVIFITARDEADDLVEAFRAGGADYITKPFAREEVLARVDTHLHNSRLTRTLLQKNVELEREIARREAAEEQSAAATERLDLLSRAAASHWGIDGFIGHSRTIQQILTEVQQLQNTGTTSVLISGESGTGKELIARAIHFGGTRAQGPFIALNCSAIPSELAESTLFGHVKGAFSGAHAARKGSFYLADGGTLFLDEIGDMPVALQAKLLRVLEEGIVTPVGGEREQRVDVRVVAATNADLQQQIGVGAFRQDLFFRLARFPVRLPPLRERREDIALLARHFLHLLAGEMGLAEPLLSTTALAALEAYNFPGNIRELKNMIEHALIKSQGSAIAQEHLNFIEASPQHPAIAPDRNMPQTAPLQTLSTDESAARILVHVREHGSITNEQCRILLDAEHNQASYLLKKMARNGLLVRFGERRWTFYRLAQNA